MLEGNESMTLNDGKRNWLMMNPEPVLTHWAAGGGA